MKFLIYCILAISILAIIRSIFIPSPPYYEVLSNKIVAESSKKISKDLNLSPIGSGGSMMEDIEMLALSFSTKKTVKLEKGRFIIVQCANQFLSDINQNIKIRPYLHNYPFTEKNIEIRIFCEDKNGNTTPAPYIGYISLIQGEISYKYYENEKQTKVLTETFEEAEKTLHSSPQPSYSALNLHQ